VLNNNCQLQLQRAREGRFASAKLSLPEKYGIRHMKLGDSNGTGKGERRGEYKPETRSQFGSRLCFSQSRNVIQYTLNGVLSIY